MAGGNFSRPANLPEWATQDINLPATGQPNKETPTILQRQQGFEYLEQANVEYENSWRNNVHCWSGYLDDQVSDLWASVNSILNQLQLGNIVPGGGGGTGLESSISGSDGYIDVGDVREVFTTAEVTVPGGSVGSAGSVTVTKTLPHTFASAPVNVQLTADENTTTDEATIILHTGDITASTVEVKATRVITEATQNDETLVVSIKAIGMKPSS